MIGENATSLLVGGEQENGRRGGTENYPAIVAASVAWESHVKRTLDISLLAGFRNHFEKQMENLFPGVKFLGKSSPRLWNTSLFIMPKFDNLEWVAKAGSPWLKFPRDPPVRQLKLEDLLLQLRWN